MLSSFINQLSEVVADNVLHALNEDVGSGDLTAQLVDDHYQAKARVVSREPAVLCGRPWFDNCFHVLDETIDIHWLANEGQWVEAETVVCELTGNARAILTGERSALNFLQLLSATATRTRRYVEAVGNGRTKILDTRKTIPGLRMAQKYAVTVGGGHNHRMGLYDGVLIKENHILMAGGVKKALERTQTLKNQGDFIQIEVETLSQFQEAIEAGAKMVLLDNMSLEEIAQAVTMNEGRAQLEVSGSVNFEDVGKLAAVGVDRLSIGALTKNLKAIDFSMRFDTLLT